jgi:hypothetical protein
MKCSIQRHPKNGTKLRVKRGGIMAMGKGRDAEKKNVRWQWQKKRRRSQRKGEGACMNRNV